MSAGAQTYSIQLLQRREDFSARLSREIRHRPEGIVVTDVRWAPQDLFAAFYDKAIFYVRSKEQKPTGSSSD